VPLAAAPRFDDVGRDDIHEELGECPMLGVVLEMVGLVIPRKRRVEQERQEQIKPVVDHLELPHRALLRGVKNDILLGAMGADVAFDRELARDDVLDRNLLFPAVAAVAFVAAWFGDLAGAAQGATCGFGRLPGHSHDYIGRPVGPQDREGRGMLRGGSTAAATTPMTHPVRVSRLLSSVALPAYQTPGAAGFDLAASVDMTIAPGEVTLVPTGLVMAVPSGYFLGIFARSSTPLKRGLMVANGVGIVDSDYSGPGDEIKIEVFNFHECPGDRPARRPARAGCTDAVRACAVGGDRPAEWFDPWRFWSHGRAVGPQQLVRGLEPAPRHVETNPVSSR
jgi:deoxyuridine 5'-triphosphate nucleotidohydrolase